MDFVKFFPLWPECYNLSISDQYFDFIGIFYNFSEPKNIKSANSILWDTVLNEICLCCTIKFGFKNAMNLINWYFWADYMCYLLLFLFEFQSKFCWTGLNFLYPLDSLEFTNYQNEEQSGKERNSNISEFWPALRILKRQPKQIFETQYFISKTSPKELFLSI